MARQGAIGMEELIRKKVASLRRWKMTKLGKRHQKSGFEFTVMTYNILSQTAIENHRYLYKSCSPEFLEEDYRISKIMPEILQSKSDVICLQEVEQQLFESKIKEVFDSKGFGSIFKKRTGFKTDGCAILWKKKKFNLLDHRDIEFKTNECGIMDRDNVGLIAVLKPKHPASKKTKLHVATTHLLFNPRRGDVKLCQLRILLAELEKMALRKVAGETRMYHPVILCGDFNFEPNSPLYHFIESGRLDIVNMMSGNMSGQSEGKGKGRLMKGKHLSLEKIGINEAGRFEDEAKCNSLTKNNLDTTDSANPTSNSFIDSKGSATGESMNVSSTTLNNGPLNSKWVAEIESSNNPKWIAALRALNSITDISSENKNAISEGSIPALAAQYKNQTQSSHQGQTSEFAAAGTSSDSNASDASFTLCHDFHFVPTYRYHETEKSNFPVTSMTGQDFSTVDHIFYHVKEKQNPYTFKEDKLKLLGSYKLLHSEDLLSIGGLPNASLGSDHICLMSKFLIYLK